MMKSKYFFSTVLLLAVGVLLLMSFTPYNTADSQLIERDTISVSKDTYVNNSAPDTNYGTNDYLYVGNINNNFTQIILGYNLSQLPADYDSVVIKIRFIGQLIPGDFGNLEMAQVYGTNDWNETEITFNSLSEDITQLGAIQYYSIHILSDSEVMYSVDITDLIGSGDGFTILFQPVFQEDYRFKSMSRENTASGFEPYLEWEKAYTCPASGGDPDIPGYSVVISVLMIGVVAGVLAVVYSSRKKLNS